MSLVQQPDLNEDGTQRRKYELDDNISHRLILRGSIALAMAGTIALIKNLLFPGSQAETPSKPASAGDERTPIATVKHGAADGEAIFFDHGESAAVHPDPIHAFARLLYASTGPIPLAASTVPQIFHRQPGGPPAGNDNQALYGAAPGRAITLATADGIATLSNHGGGPGAETAGKTARPSSHDLDDEDSDDDERPQPIPHNRAPIVSGSVFLGNLLANQALVISLSDLLRNASDPDGDQLEVAALTTSSGKLTARGGNEWLFVPVHGDTSDVTFQFVVSDGALSAPQLATLDLLPLKLEPLIGTDEGEALLGTSSGDVIDARGGHDLVVALDGDDVIHGGSGNDRIVAGAGNDVIDAGEGDDVVFAGAGNDVVSGGSGDDVLFGEEGDDLLRGDDGDDRISGGDGRDILLGNAGDDQLSGDADDDLIDGGEGRDDIDGGAGDDILLGAEGDDRVEGGDGDDLFIATVSDGGDTYVGGAGRDTLDLSATAASAQINLAAGVASSADIGSDEIAQIENVKGGSGGNTITGNDDANAIAGGIGNDVIDAGGGDDLFIATVSDGDDTYLGGAGRDTLDLSATAASAKVNLATGVASGDDIGSDQISQIENVKGGSGDDTITGNDDANAITGGIGNDVIDAGGGDDSMIAVTGDGDDRYLGGDGSDTYDMSATTAAAVVDLVAGTANSAEIGADELDSIENIKCGSGDDVIVADEHKNVFVGGAGNDTFVFGSVAAIGHGRDRDEIRDFEVGDRIDLEDISDEFSQMLDATFEDQSMRRFVLIGSQEEFTKPGQMRVKYDNLDGDDLTILEGNIDNDTDAEFELALSGLINLRDDDFLRH